MAALINEEDARDVALSSNKIQEHLSGKEIVKIVFVSDRCLLSIVAK